MDETAGGGTGPRRYPSRRWLLVIGAVAILAIAAGVAFVRLRSGPSVHGTGQTATAESLGTIVGPPLVGKDRVVLFSDDAMIGVDPRSREIMWRSDICRGAAADAIARTFSRRVIVWCEDGRLMALDPSDGSMEWSEDLGHTPDRISVGTTSIAISSTDVTTTTTLGSHGTTGMLSVRDAATGVERWNRAVANGHALAVDDGDVYSGEGNDVVALDATTGSQVWSVHDPSGSLWVDQSMLVNRRSADQLAELDRRSGEQQWATDFRGGLEKASLDRSVIIGVSGGRIVTRSNTTLAGFSTDDGSRSWAFAHKAALDDATAGDQRVAAIADGQLSILDAADGTVLSSRSTSATSATIGSKQIAYVDDTGLVIEDLPALAGH